MTGDGRKVQCCKEQYCIGTWNVMYTNQGKLEQREADRRYAMFQVRRGGQEEVCHVQGQERPSRSGAAPERRYAMSKVRSSSHEEVPHIQRKEQDGALLEEP